MDRPTKMQEREHFLAEFVRRLREAPPGTRVYMRVGDVFKDADVIDLNERRGVPPNRYIACPARQPK